MSSPSLDIHTRLLTMEAEFFCNPSLDNPQDAARFAQNWVQLHTDIDNASQAGVLDKDTMDLAHDVASEIAISAESFLSVRAESDNITTALTHDLEEVFDGLLIRDNLSRGSRASSPPPATTRTDPSSLPPYIEPAYKWLLRHLHNPYPNKEVKQRIADETGSNVERISDWFIKVRGRMRWTRLLREEFKKKRADLVEAATRYYTGDNHKNPLPPNIVGKFVAMEEFAKEMYAAKFVPSALSNKLTAAVKDLTPELQDKAREERWLKLQAQRDVARLGAYPSPAPSGYSSPISDNGASTSFAGRKRSSSEASDSEESHSKRPRFDNSGAFSLPSPPYSGDSSPINLRKRRLSDADSGPGAKRPRNRGASDPIPVTITLTGTPDILADWFTSDREGDTDIFEPGQLLDIKFFDPAEYDFSEEALATPRPAVKALPPSTSSSSSSSSDTVTFDIPGNVENLFNFDFSGDFMQPPPLDLDQSFASYPPVDSYGPIVYEPPFLEPFSGTTYNHNFITRDSVAESFGFESFPSADNPQVYSAFPDGKASGTLINGLFDKMQNEYMYQQPVAY
ncbi:C-terminal domain of homeodomain 1-domain-containing protein [Mycena filopes]|nr:C-terminal domain of homeodomain 1-domain-containing protein [Mycena filopes]